jgi:hypothetical protein
MKKGFRIGLFICGFLNLLIGLAFAVIEGRLLLSGEISFYASPSIGWWKVFFRLLASLMFLTEGLLSLFLLKKGEHYALLSWLFPLSAGCFISMLTICLSIFLRPGPLNFWFLYPLLLILSLSTPLLIVLSGFFKRNESQSSPAPEETPRR